MITIHPSATADSRTCDFANVDRDTLLAASVQHIGDVRRALSFFSDLLRETALRHDYDKISDIDGFHANFVTGFAQSDWLDRHYSLNRHHLNAQVPDDVNLIDVLDMIADCVMAGMARSGSVRSLELPVEVLVRAFENTVELLCREVRVVEPDDAAWTGTDVAEGDAAGLDPEPYDTHDSLGSISKALEYADAVEKSGSATDPVSLLARRLAHVEHVLRTTEESNETWHPYFRSAIAVLERTIAALVGDLEGLKANVSEVRGTVYPEFTGRLRSLEEDATATRLSNKERARVREEPSVAPETQIAAWLRSNASVLADHRHRYDSELIRWIADQIESGEWRQ